MNPTKVIYKALFRFTDNNEVLKIDIFARQPNGAQEVVTSVSIDEDSFPGGLSLDKAERVAQVICDYLNGNRD